MSDINILINKTLKSVNGASTNLDTISDLSPEKLFIEKYDMYLFNEVLEETKMQRIEDVKDEGYCAYVNGISKSDNPYNNNEEWDYFLAWDEGFMNAAWDD